MGMVPSNTSTTEDPSLPPVDQYPGYFSGKPPFFKRRNVQVILAAFVGLLVGALFAGGGASSTPALKEPAGLTPAQVRAKVQAAVSDAVDKATATERSRSQQELAAAKARLADFKSKAKARQRHAVAAAVARVRARMQKKLQHANQRAAAASAAASTSSPSSSSSSSSASLDPRFSYCYEANANGYGPYTQGVDPEYYWYEDADNDGVDCEP